MATKQTKKKKKNGGKRYDKNRVLLKTGESERSNGTYEYRWTDSNGKRHSVYAETLEELRRKEEQIIKDTFDGINIGYSTATVKNIYEKWLPLVVGVKDVTKRKYIDAYTCYIDPKFGDTAVVRIKKSDIRQFYADLVKEGYSYTMVRTIHNCLCSILQFAVDDELIRINPAQGSERVFLGIYTQPCSKREALSVEEQALFINYTKSVPKYYRWYPAFMIMLGTGLRVNELLCLQWSDVDFNANVIRISHSLQYYKPSNSNKHCYHVDTPKTANSIRTIPMIDSVRNAFLMEKQYQEKVGVKCISVIDGYDDFIFVSDRGVVYSKGKLNSVISRIVSDCNAYVLAQKKKKTDDSSREVSDDNLILLPHFTCHTLRHTFATRLCEAKVNIKVIQTIMGHSTIDMTLGTYIDAKDDLKRQEIKRLNDLDSSYFGLSDPDGLTLENLM